MIEIEKPNITAVSLNEDGTVGKFIVEPLERGFGITLGNSLRRIMLSSPKCRKRLEKCSTASKTCFVLAKVSLLLIT